MLAHLKGTVEAIYDDRVVIDVNGMGYNVFMPYSSIEALPAINSEVKIYTYLSVREDAMWLYGFNTRDDLDLYKLLITVNGVGPKAALQLMSFLPSDDLKFAILSSDSKTISKAPGVGPKTAQRIIIDLKDKIDLLESYEVKMTHVAQNENLSSSMAEAVEALSSLGYTRKDALSCVKSTGLSDDTDVETILKAALKLIARI